MGDVGEQRGIRATAERHDNRAEFAQSIAEMIKSGVEPHRVDAVNRREIRHDLSRCRVG